MKKIFIPIALAAAITLTACDKPADGPNGTGDPNTVSFTSNIAPKATRVNTQNNTWTEGDQIGIFMKTANTALTMDNVLAQNISYNPAADGALNPTGTAIQYPSTAGSAVDFVAYYPYDRNAVISVTNPEAGIKIEKFGFYVDLNNQANVNEILYSNNAKGKVASVNTVPLQFKYSLAKLVVTVTAATGTNISDADFSNMTATVGGMSTYAMFDLPTGSFEPNDDGSQTITLRKTNPASESGTSAIFEALVFPTISGMGNMPKTFTFFINGNPYVKTVTQDFAGGNQYNMPFELAGGATPEVYFLNAAATITGRTPNDLSTQTVAYN